MLGYLSAPLAFSSRSYKMQVYIALSGGGGGHPAALQSSEQPMPGSQSQMLAIQNKAQVHLDIY